MPLDTVTSPINPNAGAPYSDDATLASNRRVSSLGSGSKSSIDRGGFNYYVYPEDIINSGTTNYVTFYINVATSSKLVGGTFNTVADINGDRGDLVGTTTKNQALAATVASGALQGFLGGTVVSGKGAAGAVIGGGLGAAGAAGANYFSGPGQFTRPTKTISESIVLPVPSQLLTSYRVNYADEEMGMAGNIAAAISSNPDLANKVNAAGEEKAGSVGKQILETGGAAATSIALKTSPFLSAMSGLAANPRREQLFKNVDFRRFQFDYQFFPKSPGEAANILEIIRMFKVHMHPEFKDDANFLYIYPSEFEIRIYNGTNPNNAIHKFATCVLSEMTVNYNPNGVFTTFENGMPTQINMNLQFIEIALMDKKRMLEKGY
jgi:hypothetical protein